MITMHWNLSLQIILWTAEKKTIDWFFILFTFFFWQKLNRIIQVIHHISTLNSSQNRFKRSNVLFFKMFLSNKDQILFLDFALHLHRDQIKLQRIFALQKFHIDMVLYSPTQLFFQLKFTIKCEFYRKIKWMRLKVG